MSLALAVGIALFIGLLGGLVIECRFDVIGTFKKDTMQAYERGTHMWLEASSRISKIEDAVKGK